MTYPPSHVHPVAAQELLERRVVDSMLFLREVLVRGDENLKARQLMDTIPYWVQNPSLWKAREDQREMTEHVEHPEAYAAYYRSNVHDRPMEDQYAFDPPLTCGNAHEKFPRLALARQWAQELSEKLGRPVKILDLSGNDGLMAVNLTLCDFVDEVRIFDLDPRCCERARARGIQAYNLDFQGPVQLLRGTVGGWWPDVAILFETLEHLPDPIEGLRLAARYGPELYLSTPFGAMERLNLPTWAEVEPKGHLHSFSAMDFEGIIHAAGLAPTESIHIGPDGVMVTRLESTHA